MKGGIASLLFFILIKMVKYLSSLPNGTYFFVYSIGVKYGSPRHRGLPSTFDIRYSSFDIL